jgi:3-oxoacyl-[acyl-carrier-protein] synthase-3
MIDTTDEWIVSRTGIKTRRIITDETLLDLALAASKNALSDAGLNPAKLDLIICATIQSHHKTPALACLVQQGIGAACPAFDLNAACTGFIYALHVAKAYFDAGMADKILVVAAEALSQMTNYTDRGTCVLFGDGAGAVVLTKGSDLMSIVVTAKGDDTKLRIPQFKGNSPFAKVAETEAPYVVMDGQEVYKFSQNAVVTDIKKVLLESRLAIGDIDWFLIHQANARIIDAARIKLGVPPEKMLGNIEKYGNTSAACIPIMIDEARRGGKLKAGNILALSAFGGGFTTGAAIIKI